MVDSPRLRTLLERIDRKRGRLKRYGEMSLADYLRDAERIDASKYLLLTAIEDALAAANHVIASEGLRTPVDYADAFRSLADASLLEHELADRLQQMARFRNLLVHVYTEVDDRRVHEFLRSDIADLERFVQAMALLVE